MLVKKELTDSVVYTTESIFSGLCSILFYILIANYLDVQDIGAYSLAVVYASILASMANFGLVSGYERSYFEFAETLKEKGTLISSLQVFSAVSIIVFILIGSYFSEFLTAYLFGDAVYSKFWVLVLSAVGISEFTKFYLIFLRNSKQAKLFASFHIVQVITNLFLGYLFLEKCEFGVESLGISLLVSNVFILVLLVVHQFKNLPQIIDIKIFEMVARLSLPLTPRIFVGFIGTQFDKIIISQVSSLASLGVYSVAQRLAMSVYMLMNALGRVWQPSLYEELFEKGSKTDTKFLLIYMVISFLPALFLILFSKEVFMFFPETYSSGSIMLVLLCFYYLILYLGKITGQQLLFAKKTWLISGLSILTILVNILVTYPLVILYDAEGAAAGTVISALIMGWISFYFAQKHSYLNWEYSKVFFCYLYLTFSGLFILILGDYSFNYLVDGIIKAVIFFGFIHLSHRLKILDLKSLIRSFRSENK